MNILGLRNICVVYLFPGQSVYFSLDNLTAVVDTYTEMTASLHEAFWRYNETSQPDAFSFYGTSSPGYAFNGMWWHYI